MGIGVQTATMIIRAHCNEPIDGRVLVCGRQSVTLTPLETAELIAAHGLKPRIAPEACELDRETRIGGEGQPQRMGDFISDRSFFQMLGATAVEFADHSSYEGADIIVDLNQPVPDGLEGRYDFIVDGGTLDNIFNPAQGLINLSRMLRPGGRLLTYNFYANFAATYVNLPHQWYLDYFALNRFAFAQTYIVDFDGLRGRMSVYQANLEKRAGSRVVVPNFPVVETTIGIGLIAYAKKGEDSTWDQQPSQEIYRGDAEWGRMQPIFARFAAYPLRLPIVQSTIASPIIMPGWDDFQYVAPDGTLVTEATREVHYRLLRLNILKAMRYMESQSGGAPWGIFETEKTFFDLLNESVEARAIVARPNVVLFDARMLSESFVLDGITKRIHPGTAALVVNMPILVISTEPQLDVMWRRLSRLFRHLRLFSACIWRDAQPVKYADFGVYMSPSLEHGDYRGYSPPYSPEVEPAEPAGTATLSPHPDRGASG